MKLSFCSIFLMSLILAILIGCESAEKTKEMDSIALVNRGIDFGKKGQLDRAIVFFNEALELNPRNAEAYYNRGSAYAHKDQYDRAISDYSEAIELNQKYEKAYNNRGLVYYYEGKHDEACSDWQWACELGLCKNYELAIIKGVCL